MADDAPIYLLVLDRSGSMNATDKEPTSRWERLQELVADFVARRELGTRVVLVVFDPIRREGIVEPIRVLAEVMLDSDATRESLCHRILSSREWPAGLGRPTTGNTPLYHCMKVTLEQAIEHSLDGKHRPIVIRVYTDGKDEYQDPNPVTPKDLCSLSQKLFSLNSNARYVFVKIGNEQFDNPLKDCAALPKEDQPFQRSIPIAIKERHIELNSPVVESTQDIQLTIAEASSKDLALLRGQTFAVEFIPMPGEPIQARVLGTLAPRFGAQKLSIEVTNARQLHGDQEYHGELKITPPVVATYRIDGLGKNLTLRFQRAAKPQIIGVQPPDGTIVLVGQDVVFRVDTLQDAEVFWDFGDTSPHAAGHVVAHPFKQPGHPTAEVKVTDKHQQSASAIVHLTVIDAGVRAREPAKKIFERIPTDLTCTTWGGVGDSKWRISGEPNLLPSAAMVGANSTLSYKFPEAGRHFARAQGTIKDQLVFSDEVVVDVQPLAATLRAVVPEARYRKPYSIELNSEAPHETVNWKFNDPRGHPQAESPERATFEFGSYGSHAVQAELVLPGGETFKTPELFVEVLHHPQVAKGDVLYLGQSAGSAKRVLPGSEIELVSNCEGDLDRTEWAVDYPDGHHKTYPIGTRSLVFADTGIHKATLRAIGPDEAGNEHVEEQVFAFVVRPKALHEITWLVGAVSFIGVLAAFWYSLFNEPMTWGLAVNPDYDTLALQKRGRSLAKFWRKMRKTARVPLKEVVADPYFKTLKGSRESLIVKTIKSEKARGSLAINVDVSEGRLTRKGESIEGQMYSLTIPQVADDKQGQPSESEDASEKFTYLKLITDNRVRWMDILIVISALAIWAATIAYTYNAVEKWTGQY